MAVLLIDLGQGSKRGAVAERPARRYLQSNSIIVQGTEWVTLEEDVVITAPAQPHARRGHVQKTEQIQSCQGLRLLQHSFHLISIC